MFRKDKTTYDVIPETIIGKDATIKAATIMGDDLKLRIDGTYQGKIEGKGIVIIGSGGTVEGDIKISQAIIAGTVIGNITCTELIHLTSLAKITGDILSQEAIIDQGAFLDGKCKIGNEMTSHNTASGLFVPQGKDKDER